MAKDGDAPLLDMRSGRFFRQSFFITLFNPKAIVFYMAFFPLFVDSQQPPALGTFAFMAVTIAALTFLYSLSLSLLATRLRSRMQQSPWFGAGLHKLAGALLVGFGLRLIFQK
jgi:threonine/homoserine/homoserine lactone efflux protein